MRIATTGRSLLNSWVLKTLRMSTSAEALILHEDRASLKKSTIRANERGCSHSAICKATRLPLARPAQKENVSERPAIQKSHSAAGSAGDRGSPVADALATSSSPVAETHADSS